MKEGNKINLFLVDDDAVFLKSLEIEFLQHPDFNVETFATGEQCVKSRNRNPDIVILDYMLNGIVEKAMDGIETLDKIKDYDTEIPVVMLSSQDKIEVAIACMHHKAFDYVVKSETAFIRLQKIITAILHSRKIKKELNWYMARM
ncbi:MAG: response regulator [Cyclobacteriaceae bacterium]|nr:response regulator [Cyclobacteriaceae bacterium]